MAPNSLPATRLAAKRDVGDDLPISYVQDPENLTTQSFLLQLDLEDELDFHFTFVTRQTTTAQSQNNPVAATETAISGLTFAFAPNSRELDTLITREFHANPNLHKNANVQLIGDFATSGSPAIEYDWNWRWRPPKAAEDRGGGWRNTCSFLEYDSRAHRLNTLASFSFWVQNKMQAPGTPIQSPTTELPLRPTKNRMVSSQSYQSAVSDSEGPPDIPMAMTPAPLPDFAVTPSVSSSTPLVVDVSCQRPGEDMSAFNDGPVFRATMKSLEQKTGSMKTHMKKVLKKAEAAQQAQVECNSSMKGFLAALQEASASNANAIKPALDHYFTKIAQQILQYENEQALLLQKQIIDPVTKLYNLDIKQAESKKKDFEDESRDYYAYVGKYLGQRQDTMKDKKRAESDSKYQNKRRNFELKRFDYSSFMQDLHGGRKEQELLSQLTKYADYQSRSFLSTAKKVEALQPQLEALVREVANADKEYNLQRTEREEKRRNLEKNVPATVSEAEFIQQTTPVYAVSSAPNGQSGYTSDTDLSRADSTSSQFGPQSAKTLSPSNSVLSPPSSYVLSSSPGGPTSALNKFKGFRDLEEREVGLTPSEKALSNQQKKEGLLWALSKPGSHIDPKGMNKQAWHK